MLVTITIRLFQGQEKQKWYNNYFLFWRKLYIKHLKLMDNVSRETKKANVFNAGVGFYS